MQRSHLLFVAVALLITIIVSACAPSAPDDPVFDSFDPNNFDNSTNIDNEWMPLKPGTQLVFEGETIENGESVPHRVVINVTDLTKVISGVRSVVTWDLDYSGDELVEAELAFFAQDNDGNVWRMGEYPEEYQDGKFIDNPTWIHGLDNALAGIAMQANPQPGTPDYPQGWGPEVDWTDRGLVDKIVQETCVPAGCYQNVLVIKETSATEVGAFQLKYFAPGVGNVLVDWTGTDKTQETLELVEYNQLSPEEMDEVRASALELEKSAYERSKDVYSQTPPLE
ncbi:MAG: hypothetical protein L0Z71_13285 [Anaerolineae bacterium]|nr:hypothetical protein [Anaerolineae bacterium]